MPGGEDELRRAKAALIELGVVCDGLSSALIIQMAREEAPLAMAGPDTPIVLPNHAGHYLEKVENLVGLALEYKMARLPPFLLSGHVRVHPVLLLALAGREKCTDSPGQSWRGVASWIEGADAGSSELLRAEWMKRNFAAVEFAAPPPRGVGRPKKQVKFEDFSQLLDKLRLACGGEAVATAADPSDQVLPTPGANDPNEQHPASTPIVNHTPDAVDGADGGVTPAGGSQTAALAANRQRRTTAGRHPSRSEQVSGLAGGGGGATESTLPAAPDYDVLVLHTEVAPERRFGEFVRRLPELLPYPALLETAIHEMFTNCCGLYDQLMAALDEIRGLIEASDELVRMADFVDNHCRKLSLAAQLVQHKLVNSFESNYPAVRAEEEQAEGAEEEQAAGTVEVTVSRVRGETLLKEADVHPICQLFVFHVTAEGTVMSKKRYPIKSGSYVLARELLVLIRNNWTSNIYWSNSYATLYDQKVNKLGKKAKINFTKYEMETYVYNSLSDAARSKIEDLIGAQNSGVVLVPQAEVSKIIKGAIAKGGANYVGVTESTYESRLTWAFNPSADDILTDPNDWRHTLIKPDDAVVAAVPEADAMEVDAEAMP